jgi:hypothetical protein
MTTGLLGLPLSFECIKPTINSPTIWIYSSNGADIFLIEDNQDKYKINSLYELTILNLEYNDDGYYACGYAPKDIGFLAFSIFNLFVKSNNNSIYLVFCY